MINVVGTFAVTKAFLPMLKRGNKKTIVNISSDAACLTLMYSMIHAKDGMDAGMGLSYKASKCAVNMGKPFCNACYAQLAATVFNGSAATRSALHLLYLLWQVYWALYSFGNPREEVVIRCELRVLPGNVNKGRTQHCHAGNSCIKHDQINTSRYVRHNHPFDDVSQQDCVHPCRDCHPCK